MEMCKTRRSGAPLFRPTPKYAIPRGGLVSFLCMHRGALSDKTIIKLSNHKTELQKLRYVRGRNRGKECDNSRKGKGRKRRRHLAMHHHPILGGQLPGQIFLPDPPGNGFIQAHMSSLPCPPINSFFFSPPSSS